MVHRTIFLLHGAYDLRGFFFLFILSIQVLSTTAQTCGTACSCVCTSCNSEPASGCTFSVSDSSSVAYIVRNNQVLCINTGGVYTGIVTLNGGTILVYADAVFNPSSLILSSGGGTGGVLEVKADGIATIPGISYSGTGQVTLNNCGTLTFTSSVGLDFSGKGNFSVNNNGTIISAGYMSFTGDGTKSITNCSNFTVNNYVNYNAAGNICNNNYLYTADYFDFNSTGYLCNSATWTSPNEFRYSGGGSVNNNGLMTFGTVTLNGNGQAKFINNGTINTTGNFTQNGASKLNLCSESYVNVGGNWRSNGGNTLAVWCAHLNVTGESSCNACNMTGFLDFCDSSGSAPTNAPYEVDTVKTGSYIDPAVHYCECSPLPINLVSFEAYREDDLIKLKWVTASEINNEYFEVQRSTDALNFEVIEKIKGANNSTQLQHYDFTDREILPASTLYYRIRQVDYDGKSDLSPTVWVNNSNSKFIAYPNPASGNIYFKYAAEGSITIFNVAGEEVLQKTIHDATITDSIDLPPGMYSVRYAGGNVVESKKVVVF